MTLDDYLLETGQTTAGFAQKLGVTRMTMHRYRYGDRVPIPTMLRKIQQATDGKVTFDDFVDPFGVPKPSPKLPPKPSARETRIAKAAERTKSKGG